MPYTFTSGQILTASDLNNVFAQTSTTATNASTLATGTVVETVLPFRMNQNVTTTSNVTFANVTITGNLTVQGITTSINTSNLDITDINIAVAKGATTNAQANGAGVTVDFANAQMFYLNPANTWAFNRDLTPYTGNAFSLGNFHFLKL
jgi:post-segregation antitoxin (ccd killing protein)